MIILPDKNIPRSKILMPVFNSEWRTPSLAQPKDTNGNENKTMFRATAKTNDGVAIWNGWFDDRDDFDAFIYAVALGTLKQERSLWDLASPSWQPWMGDILSYEFATVTFLSSSPGSNQSYSTPSDWNNSNNKIECLGGGGSGGVAGQTGTVTFKCGTGGGGGGYGYYTNLTLSGSITYQIGIAGSAVSQTTYPNTATGNNGGATWFNGTTYSGASCGGDSGKGGNGSITAATLNGGSGGTGFGSGSNSGGRGGTFTYVSGNPRLSTGGGGAAGPNGSGNNGVDTSSGTNGTVTAGGSGDAGSGGAGGSGVTGANGTSGSNGVEWQSSPAYGSGGGGGSTTSPNTSVTAGSGGNYGGGGGGCSSNAGNPVVSGAGKQGLIVITYTPSTGSTPTSGFNLSMLGM